jgi:hypothetical protein
MQMTDAVNIKIKTKAPTAIPPAMIGEIGLPFVPVLFRVDSRGVGTGAFRKTADEEKALDKKIAEGLNRDDTENGVDSVI